MQVKIKADFFWNFPFFCLFGQITHAKGEKKQVKIKADRSTKKGGKIGFNFDLLYGMLWRSAPSARTRNWHRSLATTNSENSESHIFWKKYQNYGFYPFVLKKQKL